MEFNESEIKIALWLKFQPRWRINKRYILLLSFSKNQTTGLAAKEFETNVLMSPVLLLKTKTYLGSVVESLDTMNTRNMEAKYYPCSSSNWKRLAEVRTYLLL